MFRHSTVNVTVSALRFVCTTTLDRPDPARKLTIVHQARRLPEVLCPDEVALLLEAAPGPNCNAALATAYGAGLRVSGGRVADGQRCRQHPHDAARRAGKGREDRYVMLSPQLLKLLRAWWREGHRQGVMLPGG